MKLTGHRTENVYRRYAIVSPRTSARRPSSSLVTFLVTSQGFT
jgi:hypothetical protein